MSDTLSVPEYIYALHDEGGEYLMADKRGSVVITEAIGCDPNDMSGRDYRHLSDRGFTVIVRVNNGYFPAGTIPPSDKYADFARRCANFARASRGVSVYIPGNETNHIQERPGEIITPMMAADCFNLCYAAIKSVQPSVAVITPPVAPWDATTTYPGNEKGDWVIYARDMWRLIIHCDGIGLHTYTHGAGIHLITSEATMDADGFQHRRYEFRTYLDFLAAVPEDKRHLPVYITETDQVEEWINANTGWVVAAYEEINRHNSQSSTQKIVCLALFRWLVGNDKWGIADKPGVHADFRAAVARGYRAPERWGAQNMTENTYIPAVYSDSQPLSAPSLPPREVDPRAEKRGTRIEEVKVAPGEKFWRVKRLFTANEEESDRLFGPDRHVLANVLIEGQRQEGVPLIVTWGSGGAHERTTIYTKRNDNFAFSADYGLTPGDYTIAVADGKPSERVVGVKMGSFDAEGKWNPGGHESTLAEFELVTMPAAAPAPQPQQPEPTPSPIPDPGQSPRPIATKLIWPTDAPLSQRWGENPAYYQRALNIPYHNGVDHRAAEGTRVRAMADAEVLFVGSDPGYGLYVRLFHAALGIHTFIAHLKEVHVNIGDFVKQGDTIALSGASGNTAATINADGTADTSRPAPHTHTEIRLGSRDAYAEGTFGHSNGRVDPETVMYLINTIVAGGSAPVAVIDPVVAEALLKVESQGNGFEDGELVIRFEAHIFEGYLNNQSLFDRHFRYDHTNRLNAWYRVNESSPEVAYHNEGQSGEWGAFGVATMLNRTAALLSISMGAPQIMGFHHADIGYNTPQAMFEAFSRSINPQIIGFFRLLQHKRLTDAMLRRDWAEIVRKYNGEGFEAIYVPRLIAAYEELGGR